MKSYNIPNYIRYKEDIKQTNKDSLNNDFQSYPRDRLIAKFLPLVENIAKKFSTTTQACGVLDITDLMQHGSIGLILAVDKIEWDTLNASTDQEKTIKSFLSKRIKGSIRRAIDINRGSIKIPEHKLNEIRKDNGKDHTMVAMFFNSIFLSIDEQINDDDEDNMLYQIPDQTEPYNINLMNLYLKSLLTKHLNEREYEVLRLSYGLDCDKYSANEIADKLGIEGASAYVRISEIKKQAIKKLIDNVEPSQVLDYL
ncbi:MAG: sigma-70 family RNA polymerase sigma factor [Gloeomargaritales cyanobacterium]|jgi:RNA polymerase sigma factor (sigma-70 family)